MPQKYDVAGLGNAIVDVIAAVDDRFLLTHQIAKGVMTLVDEFRAQELHKALADHQSLSAVHEIAGAAPPTLWPVSPPWAGGAFSSARSMTTGWAPCSANP